MEVSGQYRGKIQTICQEVDGATRVTQRLEFTVPGGVFGRMASGVAGSAIRRELAQGMERQRIALEREAGEASGSGIA